MCCSMFHFAKHFVLIFSQLYFFKFIYYYYYSSVFINSHNIHKKSQRQYIITLFVIQLSQLYGLSWLSTIGCLLYCVISFCLIVLNIFVIFLSCILSILPNKKQTNNKQTNIITDTN